MSEEQITHAAEADDVVESAPDHTRAPTGGSDGVSGLALPARTRWDATDRPQGWRGRVFGLVVHTTGSGLPAQARKNGVYHTVAAVDYYSRSHGCHYVNGWRGAAGGDLLQVANEHEQANGVGVTNEDPGKDQRRSVDAGRFEADLPAVLVRHWRRRWPGVGNSLDLLPGTRTVNSCYVHVECVPCVFHTDDGLLTGDGVEPMRPGLRFTTAQHDTVADLAVDVARRNGWPSDEPWWRTARLLGHEDLTPISRHDRNGGWDPGGLRDAPYFDWEHVYARIESSLGAAPTVGRIVGPILDVLGEARDRLVAMVVAGQEHQAVVEARDSGAADEDALTNMVFFARHPELDGRRIERHETALAAEWLRIRQEIVRPALDAAPVD